MATTDQQVLNEIQHHLIETANNGASWVSGLWTVAELTGYLNQRQRRLVRELALIYERDTLALGADTATATLDEDVIDLVFLWWKNNASGVYTPLQRADTHGQDTALSSWRSTSATTPQTYNATELASLTLRVAPPSSAAGTLEFLYVGLTTALANTGVAFAVPDVCVSCIKWGVIADMLSKEGRGQDLIRAMLAESRYVEGREAIRLILDGWV